MGNVIIITQDGCPNCEKAISSYRSRGVEPEIYDSFHEIPGVMLRNDLMSELSMERSYGDQMRTPIIFEDGKLVEWDEKTSGA